MGSGLVITVLGGLRVSVDDEPRDVRGDLRRRLLLLLLAAGERPTSSDVIADALWGGVRHDGAANAVQAHVSRLRRVLDPHEDRGSRWILSRPEGYLLRPDRVDVVDWERTVEAAHATAPAAPTAALAALSLARDRWRTPVAEDLPQWSAFARRVEGLARGAEDAWSDLAARWGRPEDADDILGLARAEPLREVRWILAMRALARHGRTAEALAAYREARTLLRDDHGLDPSRDLQLTHQGILEQDPTLLGLTLAPPPPRIERTTPRPVTSFAGRTEELGRLEGLVTRARLVTVTGLGGIGKSRLVAEWILRQGRTGSTQWIDLRGASPGEGLHRVAEGLGLVGASGNGVQVTDAICAAVGQLPLTLVLDNAEDLLDDLAALAAALLDRLPQIALVVTARTAVGVPGERILDLGPLSLTPQDRRSGSGRGAAFVMAAQRLDPSASDDLVAEVAQRSGGLPLAIELLAATAGDMERGADTRQGAQESWAVAEPVAPEGLAMIAESAVATLAPDSVDLFRLLIDLPAGASPALVAHLSSTLGAGPHRAPRLLRELIGSSLVTSVPVVDPFGSPAVRHRVLQPLADLADRWRTPQQREAAVTSVGTWLRERSARSVFDPPNRPGLLSLLPEAATLEFVRAGYADRCASDALAVALDLGDFLRWSGRGAASEAWLRQALAAAGPDGGALDPVQRAEGLIAAVTGQGLARIATGLADLDESVRLLTAAGSRSGPAWAAAHGQRAIARGWRGDLAGCDADLAVARAAAPSSAEWFHLQLDLADALTEAVRGTPAAGIDPARRAAHRLLALGDPDGSASAMHFALLLAGMAGVPDRSDLVADAQQCARDAQPRAQALIAATCLDLDGTEPTKSDLVRARQAIRLMEETGNLRTAAVGRRDLGLLDLRRGRHREARRELRRAAERLVHLDLGAAALAVGGLAATEPEGPSRRRLADLAWVLARSGSGTPPTGPHLDALGALTGPPPEAPEAPGDVRSALTDALAGG